MVENLYYHFYRLMLKLHILRIDFHPETLPQEPGDEVLEVCIVAEPKWLWQR